jgi:hypothetical protein
MAKIIVYPLRHEYELEDGELEVKELGTYSSRKRAEEAIIRYRKLPGFDKRPHSFIIYEATLDLDAAWTEGYIEGNPYE